MEISVQSGGIIELIGKEKCYAAIAQAGFTAIDWNIDQALPGSMIRNLDYKGKNIFERPLEEVIGYFSEELAVIRKHGLSITQAHSPFPAYIPGHPEVLEDMIAVYQRCIELCDYAGCKNLIVHGISLSNSDSENTPEDIERMNWHLYESLIPTLLKCKVTVCLENLFTWGPDALEGCCSDAHEAVKFVDGLNAKAGREVFGLCLDTGHLLLLGKNFRTYIPVVGKRIKALHIHDNDGRKDCHLAPLTGKINWRMFCDALRQIGYDGDLSFETFQQSIAALTVDEDLLMPWMNLIHSTGEVFRKKIRNG